MTQFIEAFSDFIRLRRSDLRRIACQTRGESTFEDVCSEAYVIACDIKEKQGCALDLKAQEDQELLLGWLYNKLVKFVEKNVRYAVKLDKFWDTEESELWAHALERFLAAPATADPLIQICEKESAIDHLSLIQHSYSQTTAYLILLNRFNWSLELLANHLQVMTLTVRKRILASSLLIKIQPSLFDGIAHIASDFIPLVARKQTPRINAISHSIQLDWQFAA